jgi:hypothetical protein
VLALKIIITKSLEREYIIPIDERTQPSVKNGGGKL